MVWTRGGSGSGSGSGSFGGWLALCLLALLFFQQGVALPHNISVIDAVRQQWEKNCLSDVASASDAWNRAQRQTHLTNNCVVYYLHNHKTGGSTMCHTALNSGFHITSLDDNCNLPLDIVGQDRKSRAKGIAQNYVLQHPKLTFVAQELPPFYPNITNDKYIYITTIRNPIDRVISHIHHGFCTARSLEKSNTLLQNANCSSIGNIQHMTLSDLIMDRCFENELLWLSSNYYVSMFTGCTVNKKKTAAGHENVCSRRHLLLAQSKLHYFSVIMITDTFEDYERYFRLLELKLSIKFNEKYRVGTRENSKDKTADLRSNTSAWEKLRRLNLLDLEFYEYAVKLAQHRMAEIHANGVGGEIKDLHHRQLSLSAQIGFRGRSLVGGQSLSPMKPFCKFLQTP